jgi:hypothetical protein
MLTFQTKILPVPPSQGLSNNKINKKRKKFKEKGSIVVAGSSF